MARKKTNSGYDLLPLRVRRIIDTCRRGQRLCKSLRLKESGHTEIAFHYEPSGRHVPFVSAHAATETEYLLPANDGLLGPDSSQTWTAA